MKTRFLLITISLISFCLYFPAKAQDYIDFARTFSQREISGTARMQGMGGVSTALGGDLTSTIGNPAGLGFFNRSEFSFSPSLGFHNATTNYLGTGTDDYKTNFNFGSLGVVLNNTKRNPQGAWRGGSFGISMTRINDFHSQVNYRGNNETNDFVGSALNGIYYDNSNNIAFDNIYSELSFDTYLLDEFYDPDADEFFLETYNDRRINPGFPVAQSEIITTKGAGYTTNFSYGGNFSDKFYIGGGVAFTSLDYQIERTYSESPSGTILNDLVLAETRELSGSGFNVSLGAIYRPFSSLTVGVSYTSPTFYTLEDAGRLDLIANFSDSTNSSGVDYAPYQFEYRTPAHLNGGVSYFIGKNGFISADIEYINYGGNKYSSNQDDFSGTNEDIKATLNDVVNYRIGGEYRFNIFRARLGYAFFADPVSNLGDVDRSRHSFSIGGGIRLRDYYVDLALVNTRYESSYVPYAGAEAAIVDNNFTKAMVTVGFNF